MVYVHLSEEERYSVAAMRIQKISTAEIGKRLNRHRSTIYREVARNCSEYDGGYRAFRAGEKTRARRIRSRQKPHYGVNDFRIVKELLHQQLSPQQIVGRAKLEGLEVMSHETIYRRIWADKGNGGSLWKQLRCASKRRRKRYGRYDSRGRLAGKKMITERPAIVQERGRIGDWEIDTVHGRGKACILTVVERKSGLLRIGKLPRATGQHTLQRTVGLLRPEEVKTITADNGAEFHIYKQIEAQLAIDFYFATPHHAWERGTNENTNGLIRQYLPKRFNMKTLSQLDCQIIAEKINNRPRLRLGFKTPNEVYSASPQIRPQIASCGKPLGSCPRKLSDSPTSI